MVGGRPRLGLRSIRHIDVLGPAAVRVLIMKDVVCERAGFGASVECGGLSVRRVPRNADGRRAGLARRGRAAARARGAVAADRAHPAPPACRRRPVAPRAGRAVEQVVVSFAACFAIDFHGRRLQVLALQRDACAIHRRRFLCGLRGRRFDCMCPVGPRFAAESSRRSQHGC